MISQLVERLSLSIPDAIQRRGEQSFRSGLVRVRQFDPTSAHACVSSTQDSVSHEPEYDVRLESEDSGRWTASCSCEAFRDGAPCSHLWATVLEIQERGLPVGQREARVRRGIRPRPSLSIEAATAENARGNLHCEIRFDYDGATVAADSDALLACDPHGKAGLVERDRGAEREALARFAAAGGLLTQQELPQATAQSSVQDLLPTTGESADQNCIVARMLPTVVRKLLSDAWLVEAGGTRYRVAGELSLELSEDIDWFELSGGLAFDDEIAHLPSLLRTIESGDTTVELADGSIGLIPDGSLERLGLLGRLGVPTERSLRFHRSQGALLDAALPGPDEDSEDGEHSYALAPTFHELRKRLHGSLEVQPESEVDSFLGTLRDYQRVSLGWFRLLREMRMGGCLADDMGLGKTIQVLAMIEGRRVQDRVAFPTLIVAPRSLTFNWLSEARAFAPDLLGLDYSGPNRKRWLPFLAEHDIIVTTYGTLRRDLEEFAQQKFDYLILDEAQAIKNADSNTSAAVRALDANHRLALSGTPIENHLGELASLLDFLNPGLFDPQTKIGALLDRKSDLAEKRDRDLVRRAIRPLILRRTKEAVLHELPPRNEQILYCELGKPERHDYEELRDYYRSRLLAPIKKKGDEQAAPDGRSRFEVLAALLRLRQAACHPALVDATRRNESSAKIDTLLPLLEEIASRGHKALVFSQFTRFLSLVRDGVEARGLRCIQLDGSTRDRGELVERFQSDEKIPVFLISLMAGGSGLNLTAADYVFLLDPWWNPAVEAQAIGRAHRMGQRRTVMAYRLIAKDTVEEKVLELQRRKQELADLVLDGGEPATGSSLSLEDIEALLE
ncbi:MAG: superfamily II DNA or RNA helicase [Planctomycetota bacterium]|jgi:superfamily II DNA or RNA helicase